CDGESMTAPEIAAAVNRGGAPAPRMDQVMVCRRLPELVERGVVGRIGERECSVRGTRMGVYLLSAAQRSAMDQGEAS
ncbi:hypothetical protein JYT11_00420, partial [Planctomycetaceae bacterium AH-315-I19]|nr:hypothetical protein [Planctomycetaceae bacterium AH-315-I19]